MKTTKYLLFTILTVTFLSAQNRRTLEPAPDRSEGDGPHKRLIIRGGTLIDGTGAPPRGPVDIVIEANKIILAMPRLALEKLFVKANVFNRLEESQSRSLWDTLSTSTNQALLKINSL